MNETNDGLDVLRQARCGACGGKVGGILNLTALDRRPMWDFPSGGNVASGWGPCAMAVVCDDCIETKREIVEVVELRDGEIFYHAVEALEELPPEPTFVLVEGSNRVGIQCLRCGRTSWHPDDVQHRFCVACGLFHEGGE